MTLRLFIIALSAAVVAAGVGLVYIPAGIITAGLAGILIAFFLLDLEA